MVLRVLGFLLAPVIAPSWVQSQVLAPQQLPLGTEIRLELPGGEILRGRLTRYDAATLSVRRINRGRGHPPFREVRIVALDSIVHSWRYDGNHWKAGALVGAAVGAMGMAMFASGPASDEWSCNAGCWAVAEGIGIVFGGGIGYLVGHAIPVWRPHRFGP